MPRRALVAAVQAEHARYVACASTPNHARLRAAITNWFLEVVLAMYLPEEEMSQMQGVRELAEVKQMLSENVVKWSEKWIAMGEARGKAEGQRSILVRLARARFGAGTAAELSDQLERVSSSEQLGAIGEWLLTCGSAEALLAKVRQA